MSGHTHISKEQYRGIVKEMNRDAQRTERQRQVERAHGQDLPSLLNVLYRKHDGNCTAVLREMNKRIQGSSVSRPTLYNWLDEYEVRKDSGSGNDEGAVKTPQGIPENAISVSDESEVPEGAQVLEGDRGGLYYIPLGDADYDEVADAIDEAAAGTPAEDPASLVTSASDSVEELLDAVEEMPPEIQEDVYAAISDDSAGEGGEGEDAEGGDEGDDEADDPAGGEADTAEELGETLTENEITSSISEVSNELLEDGAVDSVEEINDGYCLYVAETVATEVEGDIDMLEHGTQGEFSHHFVEYDGQYFDAEEPEGVSDWQDLPFFDRTEVPSDDPVEVETTKFDGAAIVTAYQKARSRGA